MNLIFIKTLFRIILPALLLVFIQSAQAYESPYQVEIMKSSKELHLKQDGEIIKVYKIAHGKGRGNTKRIRGDGITPVGSYHITHFKSDSKFHFFMHLDYPNLLDAWYGYKNQLISSKEFKDIATAINNKKLPPQNTALGGYIGIHGLGDVTDEKLQIHDMHNWTDGCVALRNDEVNELRKYLSIGTKVTILK